MSRRTTAVFVSMFFAAIAAYGQVTGSLSGSVIDQNEAVIGNATVKVFVGGGKEPILSSTTNSAGRFVFSAVNPATYDVTVEASGFSTVTYRDARVSPGQDVVLPPLKLALQTISQTIEVIGDLQGIQTDTAVVSTSLTNTQIQNLPVLGRQVSNLFETQPGVVSNGGIPTSINGLKASFSNVTFDGINVQDNFIKTNDLNYAPFRTTIDQISEINIVTTNSSARYGNGASQVLISSKYGGNTYHGSVYWYNRNDALSANDWFSNRDGVKKSRLDLNQPGVALGGPVAIPGHVFRDKLFFYANYEWYRNKKQEPVTRTVLSDDAKNGIFGYNDTSGVRRTANIFSLRSFTPDPTIKAMMAQLPKSNSTGGDSINTLGYRFNGKANEFRDQFVGRGDYYLNSNNSISATYNYTDNPTLRSDQGNYFTPEPPVSNSLTNHLMSLHWRSTITPTLTNELFGGFALTHGNFDVSAPYPKQFVAGLLFSSPVNTFMAQGRDTNNYPIQDNATWFKGNHQVMFGYQYLKITSRPFNDVGTVPTYTLGISAANTTGFAAAELPGIRTTDLANANALYANLAGIITSGTQTFNVNSRTSGFVPGATNVRNFSNTTHALYVQDNWKLTRSFTVNLGLRYEYWTPLDEKDGLFLAPRLENNDVRATLLNPNATLDFIGGGSGRKFYKADKNNFAPNLGFAWNLGGNNKTVVRGGYMIAYVSDNVITTVRNNVGTSNGLSFANTQTNLVATLAAPPTIPAPTYKVPRTLADNYAISATSATGLPDPNLRTPMIHQWNVSVEHDVKSVLITARYIGNAGRGLLRAIDYNQVLYNANGFLADFQRAQSNGTLAQTVTGTYNPSYNAAIGGSQPLTVFPLLGSGGLLTNATIINLIRTGQVGALADTYQTNRLNGSVNFYTNPNIQGANTVNNSGRSNYQALQLQATKRTRAGLQAQFSYSFSKNLANNSGDYQFNFEPLLDNANPSLENARTPFDTRHVFKANYYYELPFGAGKHWSGNALVNKFIGGWSLSGIWNYQSGAPFSILSSYGTLNRAARSTYTNTASVAPGTTMDQLAPLTSGVFRTGSTLYFVSPTLLNTDFRATNQPGAQAFAGQKFFNPDAGTLGNLQRRAFSGPWNQTFDMSVAKLVKIGERQTLNIHFDFFNALNHPTFYMYPSTAGDYGASTPYNINSTTFGQLNFTDADARQIQIGAYYRF